MSDLPTLRHAMCREAVCPTCLADHTALADYLAEQCGTDRLDWLSEYRKWLEGTFPGGIWETQYGWASPATFAPENIAAFIEEWNDGWVEIG
jgi:hypothetical protein